MEETNPVVTQTEEEEVTIIFSKIVLRYSFSNDSFQEVELIDPSTLVTDLYVAASQNNTEQVIKFLEMNVPPTYYDAKTGLTV